MNRGLVLVLLTCSLLLAACSGTPERPPSVSTTARSTASTAASSATPVVVRAPARSGITFGSTLYPLSKRQLARALDDVVALRMSWIRIDVPWSAVQPISRDRYDWRGIDTVVTAARARRLDVLALVTYTPPWARASGCRVFVCPPKSPVQFAAFAAAAVARYAPRGVTSYQVWNEPNIAQFWRRPDPVAYGRVLRAAASAMRSVRAERDDLRILFGGLAFVGNRAAAQRTGDVDAAAFLRRACARRDCDVDAVGYDPLADGRVPSDTGTPLSAWQLIGNSAAGSRSLRSALAATGLGRRTVWVTSFGAATTERVTGAKQAAILADGARLAGAAPDLIGAYFVNTLRDASDGGSDGGSDARFGIVRADGTRKPAFAALQTALRQPRAR